MCIRSCFFYFLLNKQWTMFQKPTFIFWPSMKEDHSDKVVGGRYTRDMHHLIDHCRIFWPSHNKEYIYYRYLPTWVSSTDIEEKKITKISRWEIYSSRLDKKNETKKTISHLALEKQGPNYLFSPLSKTGTRQAISCLVSEKNRDQTGYFLSSLRKNNEIRQAISCLVLKKKNRD